MTYLWVYFIIEKERWPFSWKVSILLSCIPIIIVCLKLVGTDAIYDTNQLHDATHFSLKDIINSFQTSVVQIFFYRCLTNYWLGILVSIVSIVTLIKNKKKLLALWTFVSVLGYIIIMGLTFGKPNSPSLLFHIESEWACIAIIVATPFVFTFLPKLKFPTAIWLLSGIFIIRLVYIISSLSPFLSRTNLTEQILSQMRKKQIPKLALYDDSRLKPLTDVYWWGLPYESTLMSSIDGDKQQLTFLLVSPDDKKTLDQLKTPKDFYYVWFSIPCSKLDKEYFNIDSTKSYRVMTYTDFLK